MGRTPGAFRVEDWLEPSWIELVGTMPQEDDLIAIATLLIAMAEILSPRDRDTTYRTGAPAFRRSRSRLGNQLTWRVARERPVRR